MTYEYSTSVGYRVDFDEATRLEVMLPNGDVAECNCFGYESSDGYLALYDDNELLVILFNIGGWLSVKIKE